MKLIIYGNSHLIYFWDAWKEEFRKITGLEVSLVVTNYLKPNRDGTPFFTNFEHKKEIPDSYRKILGENLFDFSLPLKTKISSGKPTKILLFGSAICGEATHGNICGGLTKAQIPYHANHQEFVGESENLIGPISNHCMEEMYLRHYQGRLWLLKYLQSRSDLEVIGWVASPDLTESTARAYFGNEVVDSGILQWHYQHSWQQCTKLFSESKLLEMIINPNLMEDRPYGCLNDRYVASPGNNHAGGLFYKPYIEEILARIL